MRRCRGANSHQRAQEDVHDLARFEAEARAMRATLQRMSVGGFGRGSGGISGVSDGPTLEEEQQLEHRREFLDNALLTKVRMEPSPNYVFFTCLWCLSSAT